MPVHTIVAGVGYTGKRVLEALPEDLAFGFNRSDVESSHRVYTYDLDSGSPLPFELPDEYSVVYTIAPKGADARLRHFLQNLDPKPQRFVYISTTGVYGNRDGAIVTEATQPRPENDRARRRAAAELMLAHWSSRHGIKYVVLRSPGIYGPGRLGIERIREGVPILREEDANPGNRIHVDDLARCCLEGLNPARPAGAYNVSDGDQRSTTWFAREVARQCGLEPPPEITRQQAIEEFSATRMSFLAESRRVDSTKMREILGVTPRYDSAEEGIRDSLK